MTDTNELLALLLRETVHQFRDARAQLHADDQRAWEALGKPQGTYETTNVQRLCAEVERLRSRVGWLDHLDTPEGRAMHGSEAVRVENEQVRAQRDSLAATLIEVQRELLAARNKIRADEEHLPTIGRLTEDLYRTEHDLDAARAEVEQIKADRDSLLRIIGDSFLHLHIPHSAMAFDGRNLTPHAEESARASEIYRTERDAARAEVERLRDELREAMELLRAHGEPPNWLKLGDAADWNTRYGKLLEKHKETP